MKFSVISLSFLGFFGVLGGCSSKSVPPDPNATVAGFCESWAKAACSSTTVANCAGVDTATDALTQGCIDSQQTFCEGLVPSTGYDSAQADVCLAAVQAAYADGKLTAEEIAVVRHRGDPCNHLIKGPKAKGDDCTTDDDCDTLSNFVCVMKGSAGTCEVPMVVDNGDSCKAPDAACKPDHYCDSGSHCVESSALGDSCTDSFQCEAGLDCDATTSACVQRVSPTKCTLDGDCTTGVCSIPTGSDSGKCVSQVILTPADSLCGDLSK